MSIIKLGCDPIDRTPPGNLVTIEADAAVFNSGDQSYKLHIVSIKNLGSAVALRFVVRIGNPEDTPETISDEAVLPLQENEEAADQWLVCKPLAGKPINPSGWHGWLCLLKDNEVCPRLEKGGPSCCAKI